MHHIPPDEIRKKPKRVRFYMYASDDLDAEELEKLSKKGGNG